MLPHAFGVLVFLVTAFTPGAAVAQGESVPSLNADLGASYALPFGEVNAGQTPVSILDLFSGAGAFVGALGVQWHHVRLGAELAVGPMQIADHLCPQMECSGSQLRWGGTLEYHLALTNGVDPFFGVGAGFEQSTLNAGASSITFSGPELFDLRLGADWSIGRSIVSAGFLTVLTFARYDNASATQFDAPPGKGNFAAPSLHSWLAFGARLGFRFDLAAQRVAPAAVVSEPETPTMERRRAIRAAQHPSG